MRKLLAVIWWSVLIFGLIQFMLYFGLGNLLLKGHTLTLIFISGPMHVYVEMIAGLRRKLDVFREVVRSEFDLCLLNCRFVFDLLRNTLLSAVNNGRNFSFHCLLRIVKLSKSLCLRFNLYWHVWHTIRMNCLFAIEILSLFVSFKYVRIARISFNLGVLWFQTTFHL
jgi:hypothetical protein